MDIEHLYPKEGAEPGSLTHVCVLRPEGLLLVCSHHHFHGSELHVSSFSQFGWTQGLAANKPVLLENALSDPYFPLVTAQQRRRVSFFTWQRFLKDENK